MAKKKHGHHGGAWKVAYADFVTAMMALFLVLWLTAQDEKIKEAVERAFRNPFSSVTKESAGIIPGKDIAAVKSSEGNFDSASAVELAMLRKISEDLLKSLNHNPENFEDAVKLELTPDGMRISVFDRARKPVFEPDSAQLTEYGGWVFSTLAWELSRHAATFNIELEGHTEAGRQPAQPGYSNWELTAERANVARRKLIEHGVVDAQMRKVAGFADTQPMPGRAPTDEANRRVSVLLKIQSGKKLAAATPAL
jgi:chemotaxis protein MotB